MMSVNRQNQLLGILRNKYAMFGKSDAPLGVQGYNDFYWDEITDLAALHPEYVRYTPPVNNNMWISGKHEILPAIMILPENIGKETAAPVADEVQVEAPVVDSDTRIAELEAQVQSDAAYIERLEQERTEAQEAIAGLHTQLKKAQGDLSAAQAIIVQAGVTVAESKRQVINDTMALHALEEEIQALEAENARMKAQAENDAAYMSKLEEWKIGALADFLAIAHKAKRIYSGDVDMESAKALALGIYSLSRIDDTPTTQATADVTLTEAEIEALRNENVRMRQLLDLLHGMDYTTEALDCLFDEKDYENYAILSLGIDWLNAKDSTSGGES